MRLFNDSVFEATSITGETTGTPFKVEHLMNLCVSLGWDVNTPSAKTFDSGESEVTTINFDTKDNTTAGDYVVIYDTAGLGWAVAADKTGSDVEPTGAIWTAIPAGRKAQADISGATTDVEVAAAFELAFDALTAVPFATDDTAADGTMAVTVTLRGPTTNAVVKNADDSGAGSIAVTVANEGVASEVDITANTFTIPTHGLPSGLKGQLTTTGTLPTGVTTTTDYFVIVVNANTIKLASSLANALAGTAIDISSQGTDGAVNTFTPTAIAGGVVKLQWTNHDCNDASVTPRWHDATNQSANITADGSGSFRESSVEYPWARVHATVTAGSVTVLARANGKGA